MMPGPFPGIALNFSGGTRKRGLFDFPQNPVSVELNSCYFKLFLPHTIKFLDLNGFL